MAEEKQETRAQEQLVVQCKDKTVRAPEKKRERGKMHRRAGTEGKHNGNDGDGQSVQHREDTRRSLRLTGVIHGKTARGKGLAGINTDRQQQQQNRKHDTKTGKAPGLLSLSRKRPAKNGSSIPQATQKFKSNSCAPARFLPHSVRAGRIWRIHEEKGTKCSSFREEIRPAI